MTAASLHHRFQPPRLRQRYNTHAKFTPISAGQVTEIPRLNGVLPAHWSIHNNLNDDLICALETDLDTLLAISPELLPFLSDAVHTLDKDWNRAFGEDALSDYTNETVSTESSRILAQFAIESFNGIRSLTDSQIRLKYRPKPTDIRPFEVDGAVVVDNSYIVGVENKRPVDLPAAAEELTRRGTSCQVVDVDVQTGFSKDQPNWWVIANKGALYGAAYDTDWMIFAGATAYTVGYRLGDHMLWSPPFYNRRGVGDEFQDGDSEALLQFVFDKTPPPPPQKRLHLLFLAILLKGMMRKHFSFLDSLFPNLSQLIFDIPSGAPNDQDYEKTGRDHQVESDDSSSHSGEHGDKSADYTPPGGGKGRGRSEPGDSTTIVSGSVVFIGDWRGCLASSAGYSIILGDVIAQGAHGVVHGGALLQNGAQVSVVAVKKSDITEILVDEFSVYQQLEPNCPYIPRCFGLCISFGTAFLVTQFAQSRVLPQPYGLMPKSDRGAVYAALRCMHRLGWMHNDFLDHSSSLRNLLWSTEGTPMIIDLVTAQVHRCNGHCSELADLKRALQLKNYEIDIWARV
ncbi:hypothetical protein K438DRAFT_1810175 [Mycena galopus ATCC 62051]|nr:hypothetical protein K438DRAFT_1810175 [Mycena galopus ATCC 62051]